MIDTALTSLAEEVIVRSQRGISFSIEKARRSCDGGDYEGAVLWAHYAATLAMVAHPNFFYSKEIEDLLRIIGKRLDNIGVLPLPNVKLSEKQNKKKIVHILTKAMQVGGHTVLVDRWINNASMTLNDEEHSVVMISQGKSPFPSWFAESIKRNNGECLFIPEELSFLQRAAVLRAAVYGRADTVVLHVDPNDPVAVMAFASEADKPYVIFYNHADHLFSLGTSIADRIFDLRASGMNITKDRRYCKSGALLPIPLMDKFYGKDKDRTSLRVAARMRLGIQTGSKVVLTIGSDYKYRPAMGYDFADVIQELTGLQDSVEVFAVGVKDEGRWEEIKKSNGGRFHPVGIIKDRAVLDDYYYAADVYIEGFPFSSLTAMLEAVLYMLPVQRLQNDDAPILSGDDVALDKVVSIAHNVNEYIEGTMKLLLMDAARRDQIINVARSRVLEDHCGVSWVEKWLVPAMSFDQDTSRYVDMVKENKKLLSTDIGLVLLRWQGKNVNMLPIYAMRNCMVALNKRIRIEVMIRTIMERRFSQGFKMYFVFIFASVFEFVSLVLPDVVVQSLYRIIKELRIRTNALLAG